MNVTFVEIKLVSILLRKECQFHLKNKIYIFFLITAVVWLAINLARNFLNKLILMNSQYKLEILTFSR